MQAFSKERPSATRVLVARGESAAALDVARTIEDWGMEVVTARDGNEAWAHLQADPAIAAVILDWKLAAVQGPDLCRKIRAHETGGHMYVLLVTSRDGRDDLVAGLDAGADDYLIAPFDAEELRARFHVGLRMRRVQETLRARADELQAAASRITQISGLLPICSYCKQIRTDQNYWEQLEDYLGHHTALQFSHAICPECYDAAVEGLAKR